MQVQMENPSHIDTLLAKMGGLKQFSPKSDVNGHGKRAAFAFFKLYDQRGNLFFGVPLDLVIFCPSSAFVPAFGFADVALCFRKILKQVEWIPFQPALKSFICLTIYTYINCPCFLDKFPISLL